VLQEQLRNQPDYVKKKADSIFTILKTGHLVDTVPIYLMSLFRPGVQPYMISWMRYDPAVQISRVNCPVLIVQGSCDVQVSELDANLLHAGRPKSQLDLIPGMTHTLKNAGENCADPNYKTYTDGSLPLNTRLIHDIVDFIEHENQHAQP